MYRTIKTAPSVKADALAVVLFEKTTALPEGYRKLDEQAGGAIAAALKRPEFSTAKGTVTALYPSKGPGRLFVLGLGNRDKVTADALRIAGAKLVRAAFGAKVARLSVQALAGLEGKLAGAEAGRALGDGASIANFEFAEYKGTAGNGKPKSPALDLAVAVDASLRSGFERALAVGESVSLTRRLAATPPNVANPDYIVAQARAMARQAGLSCRVIDENQAEKLGMGGLLAVGAGGSTPPALICLEWNPRKSDKTPSRKRGGKGPVMLVGKAVTFDTGGYSIKPAENMDKMKYDKCGGMAVLGAMRAVATLKLPVHVVGLIPVAENMIDEDAYRPGDIVTFCNGVTAEITNTDAEGRLILADALAYGCKTYQPSHVIDLATLTGGVVVALGTACAGCFCHDAGLRGRLFDAAEQTGERLWHLPLWDEHKELIKGTHGDIVNSGGREAHPIQGAAFLSYFACPDGDPAKAGQLPWAHLDIAGVADVKADTPLYPKGPTGFGVRLLVRALETWR